jgi:hypothetical protein
MPSSSTRSCRLVSRCFCGSKAGGRVRVVARGGGGGGRGEARQSLHHNPPHRTPFPFRRLVSGKTQRPQTKMRPRPVKMVQRICKSMVQMSWETIMAVAAAAAADLPAQRNNTPEAQQTQLLWRTGKAKHTISQSPFRRFSTVGKETHSSYNQPHRNSDC